jgi:RNA polymerase sigma factor for flagellar operon FliA
MEAALNIVESSTNPEYLPASPPGGDTPANDNGTPFRSTARRDLLIKEYFGFVRVIAARLQRTIGLSVEVEELMSCGYKGLIEAAERYDDTQGVSFKTFSYYRIRGAMIDALRSSFWYSRADHRRYRIQEQTHHLLQGYADAEALAAAGDGSKSGTLESLADILSQIAAFHITSLKAANHVADESAPRIDEMLETDDDCLQVHDLVSSLPEKERRLIELYYFSDKTLEQAGAELGHSKSWTCRLHARAVRLLRDAIEASQ